MVSFDRFVIDTVCRNDYLIHTINSVLVHRRRRRVAQKVVGMPVRSIVIVTDNASFEMGGEAAIPLRFFLGFRKLGMEAKLFCHGRVEASLRKALSEAELRDVVFSQDTWLQKAIYQAGRILPIRLQETFVYPVIQLLTQIKQRAAIRKMASIGAVDVIFQPVPISPKALSLIYGMGVPTYFGPLNGNIEYPPGLVNSTGGAVALALKLGRALAEPLHYLFPAKKQATGLFICNQRTLDALPHALRSVPKYRSYDATIDSEHWRKVEQSSERDPTHFLFVGRLVDWKAVDLAIEATHRLGGRARLTIVGDGPERNRLEVVAASGPATIRFEGFLPHSALLTLYGGICAQLLPSLREAGGNVCLEGLAAGVPIIAVKWGGAMDVVRDGVDGFLIEPSSREALIDGFARSMTALMDNPANAREMGRQGRERVLAAFDWKVKVADYLAAFERGRVRPIDQLNPDLIHRVNVW